MIGIIHSFKPDKSYNFEVKSEELYLINDVSKSVKRKMPELLKGKDIRFKEFAKMFGDVEKEVDDIAAVFKPRKEDVVWCHGDLNLSNIIHNKDNDDIKLIDWELTKYDYRETELGYLFTQFGGHLSGYDVTLYPSNEMQERFLRIYLDSFYKNSGLKPKLSFDEDVEVLKKNVNCFALINHLRFSAGIAGLALMNERNGTKSEYDLLGYAIARMEAYWVQKAEFLGLQK